MIGFWPTTSSKTWGRNFRAMTWYFIRKNQPWFGCSAEKTGSGGYCVTLVYPIPLLPSGPGGFFGLQLHSPPKPVPLSGGRLSGESGIRTHGGVTPTHAFQACSLNHSDISPMIFRSKVTFRLYHNWSCTVAAVYDRRTSLKTGRTGS